MPYIYELCIYNIPFRNFGNCEKLFGILMTIIFKVAKNKIKTFCNKYTGTCSLARKYSLGKG